MTNNSRADANTSLFVFVKDTNTQKIKRIAVPCDMQIGMLGNPAELQLLGRLSVSNETYTPVAGTTAINIASNITIANIDVTQTLSAGHVIVNTPSQPRDGQVLFVKDLSGTSSITPLIITSPDETIDGSTNTTLSSNYGSVALVRISGTWRVLFSSSTNIINSINWSPVDYYTSAGGVVDNLLSLTVGSAFTVQSNVAIKGVRFYWAGGPIDVKVALYLSSSSEFSQLATKTASGFVTGSGYYSVLFDSPFVVTGTLANRFMTTTIHDVGGTSYPYGHGVDRAVPAFPFVGGSKLTWISFSQYNNGDAAPHFDAATAFNQFYPVEPILN